MKVFVAGASGAIGGPLIAELIRRGHAVTGMTQSDAGARRLKAQGAEAAVANAFDAGAVEAAVKRSGAEAVIDELTSLPKDPAKYPEYFPGDWKLRVDGGGNLLRAAEACGVRRYLLQGCGFFLTSEDGLADESSPLAVYASSGIAAGAQMYVETEARALKSKMESVVLRYGFFYGPGTWYHVDGGMAEQVRRGQLPIVGEGQGVWSFVHVEDAAWATVAALEAEPGVYCVVDDDPSTESVWLPKFADWLGAPAPQRVTEEAAKASAGEDAVYYGTRLVGASNAKAKRVLGFKPRRLEWL